MKALLVFLTSAFVSLNGQAANCLKKEDADYLLSSYAVTFYHNESNSWYEKTEIPLCDEKDVSNTIARGVAFLRNVQAHQLVKHEKSVVSREGAESYFKTRISSFRIETKQSSTVCNSLNQNIAAYVEPSSGSIMHVCSESLEGETPLIMSSYFIHEARHMDGYKHISCDHGVLDQVHTNLKQTYMSCDEDYESQGSYGAATGYLLDVYQTTTDPVVKQEARAQAVLDLVERFNKLPLDLKAGVLVQTMKGAFSFFDGKSKETLLSKMSGVQIATLKDGPLVLFQNDGAVRTYKYSEKLEPAEDGIVSYYENGTAEVRAQILDIYYYSPEYSCILFNDSVACATTNDHTIIFFENIQPLQFIQVNRSSLVARNTLYISATDGHLYAMPKTFEELKQISRDSQFSKSPNVFNLLSLAPGIGQEEYGISRAGELIRFSSGQKSWIPVPEFKGEKTKKLLPFIWSKTLENL